MFLIFLIFPKGGRVVHRTGILERQGGLCDIINILEAEYAVVCSIMQHYAQGWGLTIIPRQTMLQPMGADCGEASRAAGKWGGRGTYMKLYTKDRGPGAGGL